MDTLFEFLRWYEVNDRRMALQSLYVLYAVLAFYFDFMISNEIDIWLERRRLRRVIAVDSRKEVKSAFEVDSQLPPQKNTS